MRAHELCPGNLLGLTAAGDPVKLRGYQLGKPRTPVDFLGRSRGDRRDVLSAYTCGGGMSSRAHSPALRVDFVEGPRPHARINSFRHIPLIHPFTIHQFRFFLLAFSHNRDPNISHKWGKGP